MRVIATATADLDKIRDLRASARAVMMASCIRPRSPRNASQIPVPPMKSPFHVHDGQKSTANASAR